MLMKIVYYKKNSDEILTFNTYKALDAFKNSVEALNYEQYKFPFAICFYRFITSHIPDIDHLDAQQLDLLEKVYNELYLDKPWTKGILIPCCAKSSVTRSQETSRKFQNLWSL